MRITVAIAATLLFGGSAHAAVFTVVSDLEAGDATPGDGVCASALPGSPCTLHAAVEEANALAGADSISVPALDVAAPLGILLVTDDLTLAGTGRTTTIFHADLEVQTALLDWTDMRVDALTIGAGAVVNAQVVQTTGIHNDGRLTLSESEFDDLQNHALATIRRSLSHGLVNYAELVLDGVRMDANDLTNEAGAHLLATNLTFLSSSSGIFWNSGTADIANSCLASNNVEPDILNLGTVRIRNSLVGRCIGPLVSLGYNAETLTDCGFTATGDTQLVPLFPFVSPEFPFPATVFFPADAQVCPPHDALLAPRPAQACTRGPMENLAPGTRACNNGLDDDADGQTDLADPGCNAADDPSEIDLAPGDLIVTALDSDRVVVVDRVSGRQELLATRGAVHSPAGVTFTADGRLLVASSGDGKLGHGPLIEIDPETGAVTALAWNQTLAPVLLGIEPLANGRIAGAANDGDRVVTIDPDTGDVQSLATATGNFFPNGLLTDGLGNLWASSPAVPGERLFQIAGPSALPLLPTPALNEPRGIAPDLFTPSFFWVAEGQPPTGVREIDSQTGATIQSISPSGVDTMLEPRGIAVEADGMLLVADRDGNFITRLTPFASGNPVPLASAGLLDDPYFLAVVPDDPGCTPALHTNQTLFNVAISPDDTSFSFFSIPTNGNGHAAFSNGATVGPVIWNSNSLPGDVPLFAPVFGDTGLTGTLLVDFTGGSPGGRGAASTPENDDDFRLDLLVPSPAFALQLNGNDVETGERIRFLDGADNLIAEYEMPGEHGKPSDEFVGLVTCPGDPAIAAVEVDEGAASGTDISILSLRYSGAPPPVCGDLDQSGSINATDADRYQQALAQDPGFTAPEAQRCSVIGGALDCDVLDLAVLIRELSALDPGAAEVCAAAP